MSDRSRTLAGRGRHPKLRGEAGAARTNRLKDLGNGPRRLAFQNLDINVDNKAAHDIYVDTRSEASGFACRTFARLEVILARFVADHPLGDAEQPGGAALIAVGV